MSDSEFMTISYLNVIFTRSFSENNHQFSSDDIQFIRLYMTNSTNFISELQKFVLDLKEKYFIITNIPSIIFTISNIAENFNQLKNVTQTQLITVVKFVVFTMIDYRVIPLVVDEQMKTEIDTIVNSSFQLLELNLGMLKKEIEREESILVNWCRNRCKWCWCH